MTPPQTQRSLANVCLFCNEKLDSPTMCKFCGFKFCDEHISSEDHQCIKTRYVEFIRKTQNPPNITSGKFRVSCEVCGYVSKKPTEIEYAGEDLIQHTQMIGCTENIFLEEVTSEEELTTQISVNQKDLPTPKVTSTLEQNDSQGITSSTTSIVEQILKVSTLKEKGMISEEEFFFIKKELINKLK